MTANQTTTNRPQPYPAAANLQPAVRAAIVRKSDVLALALGKGLSLNVLSPLGKLPKSTAPLTAEGRAFDGMPAFAPSIGLLARPAWMVTFRMGGGDYPVQELCLCGQVQGGPVSGIRPASAEMAEVLQWDSVSAFVGWWCGLYAWQGEGAVPNYIPPACTLESFLMLLQAIDAYRRALMGSMLRHEAADNLKMTAAEFNAACRSGMQNRDTRWLAPAFVVLIPGFGDYRPSGGAETLKPSYERGFLTTVPDASGKEQRIGFGEAGRAMGLEFARTWLMGAGLESRVCASEGTRAISRCFVAPTGLTNHFVSLVTGPDGVVNANHQPLTASELASRLQAFIDSACAAAAAPAAPAEAAVTAPQEPYPAVPQAVPQAVQQPAPAEPVPEVQQPARQVTPPAMQQAYPQASPPLPAAKATFRFCRKCGTKLEAEAVFCANCGVRQ